MATRALKQEHSCEEAQILEAYCARLTPARKITTRVAEPFQVSTPSLFQDYVLTNRPLGYVCRATAPANSRYKPSRSTFIPSSYNSQALRDLLIGVSELFRSDMKKLIGHLVLLARLTLNVPLAARRGARPRGIKGICTVNKDAFPRGKGCSGTEIEYQDGQLDIDRSPYSQRTALHC